jgi:hypothetical protein
LIQVQSFSCLDLLQTGRIFENRRNIPIESRAFVIAGSAHFFDMVNDAKGKGSSFEAVLS